MQGRCFGARGMHQRTKVAAWIAALAGTAGMCSSASAVILYSSSVRNTSAPGSLINGGGQTPGGQDDDPRRLLNSGWQWQGLYQNFIGIPIAGQYFITAKHAGAQANTISVNGATFTIDKNFNVPNVTWWVDDPNSDLRIFRIQETFPSFAPLYNGSVLSHNGKRMVVFGRGTQRGEEVRPGGELKGWKEGALDGQLSWGENVIENSFTQAGYGRVFYFDFSRDGVTNEAFVTDRDSTGGIFIESSGQWQLAGITLARDSPWRVNAGDAPFNASIFDGGGLYPGSATTPTPNEDFDIPANAYATMISTNLAWITSITGASAVSTPEPAAASLIFLTLPLLGRRRR